MNSRVKNLLFWVVVGLFMILLFNLFTVPSHAPEEPVIFSEFMNLTISLRTVPLHGRSNNRPL